MNGHGLRSALGAGVTALALTARPACPAALQSPGDGPAIAIPVGLDLHMPVPEDNPLTAAKAALGRRLFFDPILSADRAIRCATCHDPARAFADGRPRAVGVFGREGPRGAPSLLNAGYARRLFWDGRASSLDAQVLQPIVNPTEMGMSLDSVVARLRGSGEYRAAFAAAFPDGVTATNLGRALASYVRTLLSGGAPVDRFYDGDPAALGEDALRGFRLFVGKAGCNVCHLGALFSDDGFHNTGVGWGGADTGRHGVTGREEDRGRFNTPSLRNVALTAPYMHDGSLATLDDVVAFYDRGGNPNPNLAREVRPLGLTTRERADLAAFLRALTGSQP